MKRARFWSGSSGRSFGEPVHIVLAQLERQKVRVGEIAVVMRLFL